MNKLELWRKGDKITAKKLNDALIAVNDLIEAENERVDQTTTTKSDGQAVQYNSVSYNEQIPTWYQEVTPLWNQDGEAIIYDTWDGLGKMTEQAGLYNREVGINAITATSFTDNSTLNLIMPEGEIKAGQQIVQVITVNAGGSITKNEVMIYDSLTDIPPTTINPQGESKIYRRLSRIISDCSNGSAESMPYPSAAWLYKAVATNDFTLSPITINAISAELDTDGGSSSSDPDTVKKQVAQLLYQAGIFHKIKGIENNGGLEFYDTPDKLGIRSGVEFYESSVNSVECGGDGGKCFSGVCCGLVPRGKKVTVANFPITKKAYEWDSESKSYKLSSNTNNDTSLRITLEPVSCNSWQWGFTYCGSLGIETYKYIPDDDPENPDPDNPTPTPTPSTPPYAGEGIQVNGYEVSRNLYLEAMSSTDESNPEADNGIKITCKRDGNKVTYTLYAPTPKACTYEFDPNYFIVSCKSVTLNRSAIDEIVQEAVSELGVSVEVSGIVECTFKGTLYANTSGTLSLSTNVTY